uniref:Uncharacterized protein n=1 Tax=Tetradesmus obliquus TaxID=3088 RepID=A0A383W442_TETOB
MVPLGGPSKYLSLWATKTVSSSSSRRSQRHVAVAAAAVEAVHGKPYHTLPSEADGQAAVAPFSAAAAAAEAAQQQLLSGTQSSPLSELLTADAQLREIAQVYATVQSLHHKALLRKLQKYGPCAASLPGFAYACVAEALGMQWAAQPGAKVDLGDLHDLTRYAKEKFSSSGSNIFQSALAGVASDLLQACSRGQGGGGQPPALREGVQLLVLPDLRTLLLECVSILEQLVAQLLQQGQQQHGASANSRQQPVRLTNLEDVLVQLHDPGVANAPYVASIASHAVRLLPPAETRPLDLRLQQMVAWRMATPAVYLTYRIGDSIALLPLQLLSLLQQQLFAAVAYSTAMQQLEGARPLLPAGASDADVAASWGPVKQVGGAAVEVWRLQRGTEELGRRPDRLAHLAA